MARTRAAGYQAQRDHILGRAVEAFARTGYAAASMSGLARACGVSKATLYHYFPGKQALLFEALDRYTRRLVVILNPGAPPGADASPDHAPASGADPPSTGVSPVVVQTRHRRALRETLRALMAEYRHSHAYHTALLHDLRFLAPAEQEQLRAQQRAVVASVATLLDRAAPGSLAPTERSVITMALLGMINFTFAWLRPDGPVSHERFADLAACLWLDGLDGLAGHPSPPAEDTDEQGLRIES